MPYNALTSFLKSILVRIPKCLPCHFRKFSWDGSRTRGMICGDSVLCAL